MLYQLSYLATRGVREAQREHTGPEQTGIITRGRDEAKARGLRRVVAAFISGRPHAGSGEATTQATETMS